MEETLQVHPPACDRVTGWEECTLHHSLPGPRPAAGGSRHLSPTLAPRQSGQGRPGPRLPGSPSAQESGLAGSISGGPGGQVGGGTQPQGGLLPPGAEQQPPEAGALPAPRGSWRGRSWLDSAPAGAGAERCAPARVPHHSPGRPARRPTMRPPPPLLLTMLVLAAAPARVRARLGPRG